MRSSDIEKRIKMAASGDNFIFEIFLNSYFSKTATKTYLASLMKRQTGGTSSDNEWQRVVQRMTTSCTTSDNEWQRVITNGDEWQRVRAVVRWMKTAQYTSKNRGLPSFQRQKEIRYYFKRYATTRVVK